VPDTIENTLRQVRCRKVSTHGEEMQLFRRNPQRFVLALRAEPVVPAPALQTFFNMAVFADMALDEIDQTGNRLGRTFQVPRDIGLEVLSDIEG